MSNSSTASLSGRLAVVTGASSGIGEATARLLASRGASVALLARRKEKLAEIAKAIATAGGKALALPVDVTDMAAVAAAAKQIAKEWARWISSSITPA